MPESATATYQERRAAVQAFADRVGLAPANAELFVALRMSRRGDDSDSGPKEEQIIDALVREIERLAPASPEPGTAELLALIDAHLKTDHELQCDTGECYDLLIDARDRLRVVDGAAARQIARLEAESGRITRSFNHKAQQATELHNELYALRPEVERLRAIKGRAETLSNLDWEEYPVTVDAAKHILDGAAPAAGVMP